jgi:hypothetical protein
VVLAEEAATTVEAVLADLEWVVKEILAGNPLRTHLHLRLQVAEAVEDFLGLELTEEVTAETQQEEMVGLDIHLQLLGRLLNTPAEAEEAEDLLEELELLEAVTDLDQTETDLPHNQTADLAEVLHLMVGVEIFLVETGQAGYFS